MKKSKVLFWIVGIIVTLAIVFVVFKFIIPKITESGKSSNELDLEPLVDNYTDFDYDYKESLKKEPSDIEGLTKYEKYSMGLNPADGSDSDRDGLSDKEEIELYQSDPLNKSTDATLKVDTER